MSKLTIQSYLEWIITTLLKTNISYKILINRTIQIIITLIGCSLLIQYVLKHTMYMHILIDNIKQIIQLPP